MGSKILHLCGRRSLSACKEGFSVGYTLFCILLVIIVGETQHESWLYNCKCLYFYVGFPQEQNAVTAGNVGTRITGAGQETKKAPGCQRKSVPEQRPFTPEDGKRRPKTL